MNDDIYIQEQIPTEEDAYARALLNEQAMLNMCPPENQAI